MPKIYQLYRLMPMLLLSTTWALSLPSVDDYTSLLRDNSAPSHQVTISSEHHSDWLSSIRDGFGNALRWVGDQVRKPENDTTDIGVIRNIAKKAASTYIEHKTGLTITESMRNMAGNGLRWLGSKVRTYHETPTLERAIMKTGNISALSQSTQVIDELQKISRAFAQTEVSSTSYLKLVDALQNRGHAIQKQAYDIFTLETAKEVLKDSQLQGNETAAKRTLIQRLASFLEDSGLATTFASIQNYVSDLYQKVMTWIRWRSN
ncbi:MAG TPA: hypothetical protein VNJ29_01165 [Candidatus Nitrosotenuis sp.]|jgi:hypothetical protein|nr:hypothetical protein [Candidatus Nitrosotenuis sp.]